MSEHGHAEGEASAPASGLAKFADSIEAFYRPIYNWLGYVGAAALGGLVLAMMYSVIGRRFLGAPLKGSNDLSVLALVIMTFTVLAAEHMERHEKMTVDVIISRFPRKVQAVVAPLVYLLAIAIFCVLCWQLVLLAGTYREAGQTLRNLDVPIYPFAYLAALGILTMIPIYVVRLLRSLAAVKR